MTASWIVAFLFLPAAHEPPANAQQTKQPPEKRETAEEAEQRTVHDFADLSRSRAQLLAQVVALARKYAGKDAERFQEYAKVLRQMVAEDEARLRNPPKPIEQMTQQERIAELIYRLRDQTAQQHPDIVAPRISSIFTDWPKDGKPGTTPADELGRIGYAAVPQLIDALTDKRLSRAVNYHRWGDSVLCVGDCALGVLDRVAHRSFVPDFDIKEKDARTAETEKMVRAWWADYQKKGEKQMLIEGTEAGDWSSPAQAKALVEKYPDAALAAIRVGMTRAKEDFWRGQLVIAACKLNGDDAIAFFIDELKNSSSQYYVAKALHERGRMEGVAAMIQQWRQLPADLKGLEWLPAFLAQTREPDALNALADGLARRPTEIRRHVVESIGSLGTPANEQPLSAQQRRFIEDLLAARLNDGCLCHEHRICDVAAAALAAQFGAPKTFGLDDPYCIRDRQLVQVTNLWRQRRGMAPLPALPPRQPKSLLAERSFQAVFVRFSPGSADPGSSLRATLRDLEGKPLTAEAVMNLWCHVVCIAAPMTRVQLIVERPGDGGGVEVRLGLYPEIGMTASQNEWRYNQRVVVEHKALVLDRITDRGPEDGRSAEDWAALRKAVTDAFTASPDKYMLIEVDSATNR